MTLIHQSVPNEELALYARQLSIMGQEKHNRLRQSKVLVIGCGGLGTTCVPYLYHAGVHIGLSDDDLVETSNLHRQFLHVGHVGMKKSESFQVHFPLATVHPHFNADTMDMVKSYDMVLDCVDNPAAKYLINIACLRFNIPWISASAVATQGQLTTFTPSSACYECLYPSLPPMVSSCDDMGVIGPCPGAFGCFQAIEAIKYLSQWDHLEGQMIMIHFQSWTMRKVSLRSRRSDCTACHQLKSSVDIPTCHANLKGVSFDEFFAMKEDALIVDVRPAEKFSVYHIPGALNLPIKQFTFHPKRTLENINNAASEKSNIIFICRRGNDAQVAMDAFSYDKPVFNVKGGYTTLCQAADYL